MTEHLHPASGLRTPTREVTPRQSPDVPRAATEAESMLPQAPGLPAYLSSCGAVALVMTVAIFAIFLPALILPYAFTDDYPILFIADGLGSSLWFGHSVIDTLSASGRPLAGLLDQLVFSSAGTIDNLRFVRLAGVVGIVAVALLLHWALVRSRIRPIPAALIATLVCSMPAFEIYGSWAVLFNAPYAALLGGGASMLAVAALDTPRNLVLDRLIGAGALLLGAVLIYQPTAMFFWVFLAVALVGAVPDARRALRLARTHAAIAVVVFALAYLIHKLAVHLANSTTPSGRNVFVHDPAEKIRWFFRQPLYWSLNLFDLTPSRWLAGLVVVVAVAGILLALQHRRAPAVPFGLIGLALVPLCLLPNLVVIGTTATYRMLGSLSALVVLYFCLGAFGIWLAFVNWLKVRVSRPALVRAERMGLAVFVAFVTTGVVVAARNITSLIVVPQNTELRMIRNQVAALPPGVPRVAYVVIGWNQGLTDRLISDEFVPSSTQPWTGEPAVVLTLRDQGRLPRGTPRPVVDPLPFDTTAFPTSEPVIDLRKLGQLR